MSRKGNCWDKRRGRELSSRPSPSSSSSRRAGTIVHDVERAAGEYIEGFLQLAKEALPQSLSQSY